jgi:Domain of unknown function (DUF4214)
MSADAMPAPVFRPSLTSLESREVPATLADAGRIITRSQEFYANEVAATYQAILNRPVDLYGKGFYATRFAVGIGTVPIVEADLLSSDEFYTSHGSTNSLWVYFAYDALFHRGAGSADIDYWTHQLNNGATRHSMAVQLVQSIERSDIVVQAVYQRYFGRAANTIDRASWVPALHGGMRDEDFIAGVLASPEFQAQHYGKLANTLKGMYVSGLGRVPESGGFKSLMQMTDGFTADGLVNSALYVTTFYNLSVQPTIPVTTANGANPLDFRFNASTGTYIPIDFATNDAVRSTTPTPVDRVNTNVGPGTVNAVVDPNTVTGTNFANAGGTGYFTIMSGSVLLTFGADGLSATAKYTVVGSSTTASANVSLSLA